MPGEGAKLLGGEFEVIADSKQTGGEFSMVIITNEPGPGHPINTHSREAETFYVLEGQYRFTIGDKVVEGGPGTLVVNPANVPHTFESTTHGRVLAIYTPGGFENFFIAWDKGGLKPGPDLGALEAKHGIVYP